LVNTASALPAQRVEATAISKAIAPSQAVGRFEDFAILDLDEFAGPAL
jgi:hypothetical protein